MPCEVEVATSNDPGQFLPAQTGECFLQTTSESVHPVAFPEGEEDPLRSRRLHLAPQISGDDPLKFPSGLVVDLDSVELTVGATTAERLIATMPLVTGKIMPVTSTSTSDRRIKEAITSDTL
jgi:hypothetical protein